MEFPLHITARLCKFLNFGSRVKLSQLNGWYRSQIYSTELQRETLRDIVTMCNGYFQAGPGHVFGQTPSKFRKRKRLLPKVRFPSWICFGAQWQQNAMIRLAMDRMQRGFDNILCHDTAVMKARNRRLECLLLPARYRCSNFMGSAEAELNHILLDCFVMSNRSTVPTDIFFHECIHPGKHGWHLIGRQKKVRLPFDWYPDWMEYKDTPREQACLDILTDEVAASKLMRDEFIDTGVFCCIDNRENFLQKSGNHESGIKTWIEKLFAQVSEIMISEGKRDIDLAYYELNEYTSLQKGVLFFGKHVCGYAHFEARYK
eukprot:Gregarina_sp_Poly_1__5999@NODE_315_length_9587_cov_683_543592_g270_i0_p4_GENE_NODE_315_length_9587_cov_683_543592_g270_i0NODE_315_length_9587_cov_683_543592_g270_i0_p4_ORF_typecomplete_len316_score28_00_NODE_315_length_9587_cov_683_543592_g270_i09061853